MSEISEKEIQSMTKEQNYIRGYKDGRSDVLCVVDAMVDLFIRTINKYKAESEDKE